VVDEAGLDCVPLGDKTIPLGGVEIADLQGFHAGFAVSQFVFGLSRGAVGNNGAVVLGAETIAEGTGFGFAVFKVGAHGDESGDDERKRGDDELAFVN